MAHIDFVDFINIGQVVQFMSPHENELVSGEVVEIIDEINALSVDYQGSILIVSMMSDDQGIHEVWQS